MKIVYYQLFSLCKVFYYRSLYNTDFTSLPFLVIEATYLLATSNRNVSLALLLGKLVVVQNCKVSYLEMSHLSNYRYNESEHSFSSGRWESGILRHPSTASLPFLLLISWARDLTYLHSIIPPVKGELIMVCTS